MKKKTLSTVGSPICIIDPSLEKYKGQNLFPESLKRANEALKGINLQELMAQIVPKKA